jgi:hypothetical protein
MSSTGMAGYQTYEIIGSSCLWKWNATGMALGTALAN